MIELISSPVFLSQVFDKLPLNVSYYYDGRILSSEQYKSAPYSVTATVTNTSIYGVPIYIKFNSKDKFELSFKLPASAKYKKEFTFSQEAVISEAEINVKIVNPEKLEYNEGIFNQYSYYFIINNPDNIFSTYSPELNFTVLNADAKTVQISIKDQNPYKAYDIVNTIVENYKTYGIEKKRRKHQQYS